MTDSALLPLLERICASLDRLAPPPPPPLSLEGADAFLWQVEPTRLIPVPQVSRVDLAMLRGIDLVRDVLHANTRQFAHGQTANNALLWGARGMGKSSLVKAVHAAVQEEIATRGQRLVLVEVHREDIPSLPHLLTFLRGRSERVLLFCDDLSFDRDDLSYKSLKTVLDGGIEGRPANVLLYATSNRRHLIPRDMIENEQQVGINPGEAVDEKISLSDRFGLWLGFHACDQATYYAIVEGYATSFNLAIERDDLRRAANEWSVTRGARSGRVAWQFIQDLAGRLAVKG